MPFEARRRKQEPASTSCFSCWLRPAASQRQRCEEEKEEGSALSKATTNTETEGRSRGGAGEQRGSGGEALFRSKGPINSSALFKAYLSSDSKRLPLALLSGGTHGFSNGLDDGVSTTPSLNS